MNELVIGQVSRGIPGQPGFEVLKEATCPDCDAVLNMFGCDCDE